MRKGTIKKTTIKEFSASENLKKAQQVAQEALDKERSEVGKFIESYLIEKGYALSARMTLEAGKDIMVEPFIYKVK